MMNRRLHSTIIPEYLRTPLSWKETNPTHIFTYVSLLSSYLSQMHTRYRVICSQRLKENATKYTIRLLFLISLCEILHIRNLDILKVTDFQISKFLNNMHGAATCKLIYRWGRGGGQRMAGDRNCRVRIGVGGETLGHAYCRRST